MNSSSRIAVEICVGADDLRSVERSVTAVLDGGGDRVELCAAMDLQGTTPAPEMVAAARAAFGERWGLMVMIRPRGGDFVYTPSEIGMMLDRIAMAADAGADGVVVGALRDGGIDDGNLRRLLDAARDRALAVTFHRAFDAIAEPEPALDLLMALGVDRVLTSGISWGTAGTALDGVDRLACLLRRAGAGIEVVIGGGIGPENVGIVLDRLRPVDGRLSVHAYSSVLRSGLTDADAVRDLVRTVAAAAG